MFGIALASDTQKPGAYTLQNTTRQNKKIKAGDIVSKTWYFEHMTDEASITTRIQRVSNIKLEKYSTKLGVTKKRALEMFIDLGCRLYDKMGGYHNLLLDDRLKVKFYFDEDDRNSVEF